MEYVYPDQIQFSVDRRGYILEGKTQVEVIQFYGWQLILEEFFST